MNFADIKGMTLTKVERHGDDEIHFYTDTQHFAMSHSQDCCESVYIESIVGDLNDLVGTEILSAEEATNGDMPPAPGGDEAYLWTFYKIATIKGYVDIRWFGSSNGYYSVDVNFLRGEVVTEPTTDIAELFARDPLQLSDQDLDQIIARLREQRSQFNLGNAMAGSMKPKTAKQKVTQDLASKLDLGNLLGDL